MFLIEISAEVLVKSYGHFFHFIEFQSSNYNINYFTYAYGSI